MRIVILISLFCFSLFTSTLATAQTDPAQAQAAATNVSDSQTASSQNKSDDRYRIGFQDVLEIQVHRHPDLNRRVVVGPNGTIELFRLDKPVMAACKTDRELQADIEAAYKVDYLRDPKVSVSVAEQKSQPVAVIGSVEHPGNFYVSRRMQLIEILSQAGGPNKDAGTRLTVFRTGSSATCQVPVAGSDTDDKVSLLNFRLRDIQEGKSTLWMKPGDVVSVLDADIVYLYGNVMKQGMQKIREPITLTQAIASAEGLRPAAKKDHIRILRQAPNGGDRTELVFDLNLIDKGKVKDPFLEPGDIVAVSEDKVKSILNGIKDTIKTTVPGAVYRM